MVMTTAGSLAAAVLLVSGIVSAASAAEAWRRRDAIGRASLALIMVASALWSLAYAVEALAGTTEAREAWGAVKYIGVAALPPAWLVFTMQYSGGGRRIRARLLLALAIGPTLLMVLLSLPGTRHLIRAYPAGETGPLPPVELGPLFWPWFVYSVALVGFGTIPFVVRLLRTSQLYRRQVRLVLVAMFLVLLANVLTNVGVGVFRRFDPTPVALAIASVLLVRGIVRFRAIELLPVARTTLVETMADAVLVTDAHHRVVDLNPAAQRIVGPASTVVGRPVEEVLGVPEQFTTGAEPARRELVLGTDDGDRHFELLLSALGDGRAGRVGDLLVLRDITDRKDGERRLEHIAHHDALTGLPNRLLFADRMEQELARARREGTLLAVLFLDVDQFKVINDGLGHDFGDRVLVHVARRLERSLRARDTLARLGGDEFSVILPEITKPEDGAIVAAKLLREISQPLQLDDGTLHITSSIGIAVFPQDGRDQRTLLRRADAAMYAAKGKSPGSYEFSSAEIQARAEGRQRLEGQLRRALEGNELLLEYQPIVDLATGAISGFEALVRWDHPELGVVPPEEFAHWAEEIRLVASIDRWALGEACRQAVAWQRGDRRTVLWVNISPSTLFGSQLPGTVADALECSGLDPRCLCLELDEHALLEHGADVAERLDALESMGVSLALDDFGAGHTSLTQLRRLPLATLKISQEFVQPLAGGTDEAPIVAAMVSIAHAMGMDVVAQGVDDAGQLAVLRDLGCERAQGPVFAAPMSSAHATALAADQEQWPAAPAVG